MRVLVVTFVALVGCKGDPKPTQQPPPAVVARDASGVSDAGGAPALQLRSVALPVAKIDGAYYYAIDAHVANASIESADPRTWSAEAAKDAVGVRAATKPVAPWSLVIGKELAAYTSFGVPCPVRVTGIALLDRASAEAPAVLGRLEAQDCVPAIVGDGTPLKMIGIADASAEEAKALGRAVATLPGWAEYSAAAQRLKRKAVRDSVMYVVRTTPPIGVIAQMVAEEKECGRQEWTVGGAFELRGGEAAVLLGVIDLVERPELAHDTNGDGKVELMFGEVEAWDHGQSGGKRFATLQPIGGEAVGDVALSYYIGCD